MSEREKSRYPGEDIKQEEVSRALNLLKIKKSWGYRGVLSEMVKSGAETAVKWI